MNLHNFDAKYLDSGKLSEIWVWFLLRKSSTLSRMVT